MEMNAITWAKMPEHERAKIRDNSSLTMQLVGLEGQRVEVSDKYGETRRFWVGKSTGWKPIHLEVKQNVLWVVCHATWYIIALRWFGFVDHYFL